jgi:hypothetical protein
MRDEFSLLWRAIDDYVRLCGGTPGRERANKDVQMKRVVAHVEISLGTHGTITRENGTLRDVINFFCHRDPRLLREVNQINDGKCPGPVGRPLDLETWFDNLPQKEHVRLARMAERSKIVDAIRKRGSATLQEEAIAAELERGTLAP